MTGYTFYIQRREKFVRINQTDGKISKLVCRRMGKMGLGKLERGMRELGMKSKLGLGKLGRRNRERRMGLAMGRQICRLVSCRLEPGRKMGKLGQICTQRVMSMLVHIRP